MYSPLENVWSVGFEISRKWFLTIDSHLQNDNILIVAKTTQTESVNCKTKQRKIKLIWVYTEKHNNILKQQKITTQIKCDKSL